MDYSKLKTVVKTDKENFEKTLSEIKTDFDNIEKDYKEIIKKAEEKHTSDIKELEAKIRELEIKLESAQSKVDSQLNTLFEFRLSAQSELTKVSTQLEAMKESLDKQFANLSEKIDKKL